MKLGNKAVAEAEADARASALAGYGNPWPCLMSSETQARVTFCNFCRHITGLMLAHWVFWSLNLLLYFYVSSWADWVCSALVDEAPPIVLREEGVVSAPEA